MKRISKIMLIVLVLSAVTVPMLSCGSEPDEAELPENQVVTVQRGSITIDITAAGNLALSRTEDLTFDLFYGQSGSAGTKGTVGEVLVEEGDTVEEGQVLVTVDKDEWNDELEVLEDKVTTTERQLTTEKRDLLQAQINVNTAEQSLKTAKDNEAVKELALLNAQISLDQARRTLNTGITAVDYQAAEAALRRAETWYEYIKSAGASVEDERSFTALERAEEQLKIAQAEYDNVLSGYDANEIAIKKNQVEAAEITLAQAQEDINDVVEDVALKELQVKQKEVLIEDAQLAIEDAQGDVEDAQEELEEAQSKSPEITAPFAGFITTVNVEGGDEVVTGTVAVQLADPNKFEADILVSEMDILQVKLDMDAYVQVDAMQGLSLPAKVTHIAPTATIQSGVVNYEVKVEVQSLEAAVQEQQEARQEAIAQGELPEGLKQAVEAGRLTQEQAEERMKQGPPPGWLPPPLQQAVDEGRLTRERAEELMKQGPPPGMGPPPEMEGTSGQEAPATTSQTPLQVPEDFQLREGLTVTVSIIVEERTDVPLVPNAAIIHEGEKAYVQVVTASGETEKRAIQTGITDYQSTEVTSGLKEGEQVLIPQGTTTTSTTTSSGPPRMGLFGPPRPRR